MVVMIIKYFELKYSLNENYVCWSVIWLYYNLLGFYIFFCIFDFVFYLYEYKNWKYYYKDNIFKIFI